MAKLQVRTALAATVATLLLPAGALGVVASAQDGPVRTAAAARQATDGWWSVSRAGQQQAADCGRWRVDGNGYCVADDARNGLEVGTRFRTSRTIEVTGVRLYRVDRSELTVSIWDQDATRLAAGTVPATTTAVGWTDASLDAPVVLVPGRVYTVSYFTPRTRYAFEYGFFEGRAHTVGPVTALASTAEAPNGVHCYDDAACGSYPVRPHRSSNYWVSPLWRETGGDPGGGPSASPTRNPTAGPTSGPTRGPTRGPTAGPTTGPAPGPGARKDAPRVTSTSPRAGARTVRPTARVRIRFSEPVRRASVSSASLRLVREGRKKPVRSRVVLSQDRRQAVLVPRSRLARKTTYRVLVTVRVRDDEGLRLDQQPTRSGRQPAVWTFRTR